MRVLVCTVCEYCDTELKRTMEKFDFFPTLREIERMASLPFGQAWSLASKNVGISFRSPPMMRKVMLEVLKMGQFV